MDLEDDRALHGVAVFVEGDEAGGAVEVAGAGELGADALGHRGARAGDGLGHRERGVVGERREVVGRVVELRLEVAREPPRDLGGGAVGGEADGVEVADELVVVVLHEGGRAPPVAAHEAPAEPLAAGLAGDERGLGVVAGAEDAFGVLREDGAELRGEVRVAGAVGLLGGRWFRRGGVKARRKASARPTA